LGLNHPEQKYLNVLGKLMESEFCQGVIGGKPDKALYFIGKHDENFIYLDPHYVQEANTEESNQ
jgi:cysteine protease ATG4